MTVYEAINEMRRLSKAGKRFNFSFMSYSRERQKTEGIVEVRNAILRKRGKKEFNQFAELMEEYLEVDTNKPKHFWHPTLLIFNGQKLTLK